MIKPIPGMPTHWLYGNTHQVNREQHEKYLRRMIAWLNENKLSISKFWIGPLLPVVYVSHPDIVRDVLKVSKAKGVYNFIEPWLGQGLLIAGGSRWARNRKLLTNAFHFNILKSYIQVYNDCTDVLMKKWLYQATLNEPVLVCSTISELTLDILLQCSFSCKSECQEKETPYFKAIKELSELVTVRFISPLLAASDFLFYNFTKEGRRYKRALKVVHGFAENIIKERKQALVLTGNNNVNLDIGESTVKSDKHLIDFLDVLLTARDDNGIGLTDLEIRYEVDTFMFEGYDTTASTISWTLYCLAKYPEHQEKCREEIKAVLGDRKHFRYEDLSELKYTLWCIKETLRLYPPVMSSFRQFEEDSMLDSHLIPKEAWIGISIYRIHHNALFWDEPELFNPLRFHPDRMSTQHPYAFIPFSAGPRNCIGQNFALNEERVVIGSILNKFKITLVENQNIEIMMELLLKPNCDIKLWIQTIEQ